MRFSGVNHIAMATGDLDATIRFWRDLLGMRLIAGFGKTGTKQYLFEISDNSSIAFFEWTGLQSIPEKEHGRPISGPLIFDHISFGVDSEDDLYGLKERIQAAGFWVSEVIDHGFIHSIYSFDPNAIPIEFSWNVEGIDLRKEPMFADPDCTSVAREGTEPQPGVWPESDENLVSSSRVIYPGEWRRYFIK